MIKLLVRIFSNSYPIINCKLKFFLASWIDNTVIFIFASFPRFLSDINKNKNHSENYCTTLYLQGNLLYVLRQNKQIFNITTVNIF